MVLKLPQKAFVNKFIPKTKFYQRTTISSKLQRDFINKIQKITWKYKLAKETIGISKTENVTEIQIFEIELKEKQIPKNVLKIIDKIIPYPVLYVFKYQQDFSFGISFKQVTSVQDYYFSEWGIEPQFDFTGVDLNSVYQKLIKAFISNPAKKQPDFQQAIELDKKIKTLEKEIIALKNKIRKQKQFNRQVEINKDLQIKQKELEKLISNS
jgi:hypothetical protein